MASRQGDEGGMMEKKQAEADRHEQQILQEVKQAMIEIGSIIAKLPDHDQKRLLKLLRIPGVSWRLLER